MTMLAVRCALVTGPLEPGQTRPKVICMDGQDAGTALNLLKHLLRAVSGEDSFPGNAA